MAKHREETQRSAEKRGPSAQWRGRNIGEASRQTNQLDHAEIVSGRWLVKALLSVLVLAGFGLYLTICLLFYQGQWQFTFFPPRRPEPSVASVKAESGLPIANVHFDTTEEGVAQLDGWWIPAAVSRPAENAGPQSSVLSESIPSAPLASMVLLYCSDGHTDLPENIGTLTALHAMGINIFAFDYRGFGASQHGHPTQSKAYADGAAALSYLTGMRHLNSSRVIVYGTGVGSAVAASVAQQSQNIAGLILENPQPSFAAEVKREQHIHVLPMWLIFRDRFDISSIVPLLRMPKLILVTPAMPEYVSGGEKIYAAAAAPKQKVQIDAQPGTPAYTQAKWSEAIRNFLNQLASRSATAPN